MPRKALLLLAGLAVLAPPAFPQTADEVIARYIQARGGLARLKAVNTLRMTGRMSVGPGVEVPITLEKKRPSRLRLEMTVQGYPALQVYDGHDAWGIPPRPGQKPQRMPAEAVPQLAAQADMDGPLVDYRAKGHKVELLGQEKVDGEKTWKLRVILASGSVETYFLDVGSGLLVRIEGSQKVGSETIQGETLLEDYREAGGVLWPHRVRSGEVGVPDKQVLTVEKVEVNPPIADSRFQMPAASSDQGG
jgi:hypothetical protein